MSEPYEKSSWKTEQWRGTWEKWARGGYLINSWYPSSEASVGSGLFGSKNPHWRRQIKAMSNATTDMSAYRHRFDLKPYFLDEFYDWGNSPYNPAHTEMQRIQGDHYISGLGYGTISPSLVTKADNQAKSAFVRNINDARRVLQGGELIGEFAELHRQVSEPGKNLVAGFKSYNETVKKRALGVKIRRLPMHKRSSVQLNIVRATWLEFSFGWRPLVSEIDSVVDYVRETDPFSRYDSRKVRGVGKAEDSGWSSSTPGPLTPGPPTVYGKKRFFGSAIVVYRGQVGMRSSMSGYQLEKMGLHPSDWVPTLWELLPYSWLTDYFTNIGDMISAFSLPPNALSWSQKTVITEDEGRYVDLYPAWTEPQCNSAGAYHWCIDRRLYSLGGGSRRYRNVQRYKNTGSLVPKLEFSIPTRGTQWLNMIAVFSGARAVQKLFRQQNQHRRRSY